MAPHTSKCTGGCYMTSPTSSNTFTRGGLGLSERPSRVSLDRNRSHGPTERRRLMAFGEEPQEWIPLCPPRLAELSPWEPRCRL
jgi:hypothetical protein